MFFLKKHWFWIVLPLTAALFLLMAVRIVNSIDYRNNDFFSFWLAGRMAAAEENPYDPGLWMPAHTDYEVTWISDPTFIYPLPLSLLFIPLGLLPLKQAYIAWVALSEGMILAALLMSLASSRSRHSWKLFAPLLAGLVLFRPAVLTLINGQISGWLLMLLAGTVLLWEKGKWEWGSLLLPLLMLKPNIGAPLLGLVGIWLLVRRKYKCILIITAGLLGLLVIGLLQNHQWVAVYMNIGNLKVADTFGGSPTVWGLGYLLCKRNVQCSLLPGGIAAVAILIFFARLVFRRGMEITPLRLISLATVVTLLVTPYTWTYDQVLLVLPLVDLVTEMEKQGYLFFLAAGSFLIVDLIILMLLIFNTILDVEILNAIVPLLLLAGYVTLSINKVHKALPVFNK